MNQAAYRKHATTRALALNVWVATLGLISLVAFPGSVHALNTCNGIFAINYPVGPAYALPGDTLRVSLTIGADGIQGGTKMTVNRLRFELDCATSGIPCGDAGRTMSRKTAAGKDK